MLALISVTLYNISTRSSQVGSHGLSLFSLVVGIVALVRAVLGLTAHRKGLVARDEVPSVYALLLVSLNLFADAIRLDSLSRGLPQSKLANILIWASSLGIIAIGVWYILRLWRARTQTL